MRRTSVTEGFTFAPAFFLGLKLSTFSKNGYVYKRQQNSIRTWQKQSFLAILCRLIYLIFIKITLQNEVSKGSFKHHKPTQKKTRQDFKNWVYTKHFHAESIHDTINIFSYYMHVWVKFQFPNRSIVIHAK